MDWQAQENRRAPDRPTATALVREAVLSEQRADAHHYGPLISCIDQLYGDSEKWSEVGAITIRRIAPTPKRPFWTFYTVGVSDRSLPCKGTGALTRSELMVRLPEDWPMSEADLDQQFSWPVEWLKILSQYPADYGLGFALGDTIANGEPPDAFHVSTETCGWFLVPPDGVEDLSIDVGLESQVSLLAMLPIFESEMALKLEQENEGVAILMVLLGWEQMSTVVNPARAAVSVDL